MADFCPTPAQREIIEAAPDSRIFLSGKTGCGKTAAAAERVRFLLEHAENWPRVLVFTPTRQTGNPYRDLVSREGIRPTVTTYNSFIQSSLKLFWPLVSEAMGFEKSRNDPMFLTIEAAQILMAKLIEPKLNVGYFGGLTSSLSRVFNQVMVALHKCAAAELPFEQYAERMRKSWGGDTALLPIFDQALECGLLFREQCLKSNLLDYSLQVEGFTRYLLPHPVFREWLKGRQLHFVFDNIEEEVPAAHHLARELAKVSRSLLLVMDSGGGYRNFMGCDPESAAALNDCCETRVSFDQSFVCSDSMLTLEKVILDSKCRVDEQKAGPRPAFRLIATHHYPDMVKQAVNDVAELIHYQGVSPKNIVILAPLVSDVLYTSMERELRERGIQVYLHRPSRPLIRERATRCLLTLCELVRPIRGYRVRLLDIVQMLQTFIIGLDPMRGQLLVGRAFRLREQSAETEAAVYDIRPFAELSEEVRSRILPEQAARFEYLRKWIELRRKETELPPDRLLLRFFSEVLTREGFRTDDEVNAAVLKTADSMRKYRRVMEYAEALGEKLLNWEDYFKLVGLGMVSAQYSEDSYAQGEDTVLLSLTSAYLPMNRPADYQIWLNAGAPRWWERFYGELTNDVVLSRRWQEGKQWDALTAGAWNDAHLLQSVDGLLRRCRKQVRVYSSEMGESGQEQKSKLLYLFSDLTRRFQREKPSDPAKDDGPVLELREDEAFYPGISDEIPMEQELAALGLRSSSDEALPDWGVL